MKYFTKYLPVEGEIKEGKHVPVFKGGKLSFFQLETSDKLRRFKSLQGSEELGIKPAKLFLCSWNVKVGDKFTQRGIDFIHPDVRFTCSAYNEDEQWVMDDEDKKYAMSTVYKVIGEVSPEAIWVKEGDEFEDDEVRKEIYLECYYRDREIQFESETRYIKVTDNYVTKDWEECNYEVITFKCPTCENFH